MAESSSAQPKKRGYKWFVISGAVILVLVLLPFVLGGKDPATVSASTTTTIQRGRLVSSVLGSGTINPKQSLDLSFQTTGIVSTVLVSEGQNVVAGQILAELDDRNLALSVLSAEANLQSAEARLRQTQDGNARPEDLAASQASVDNAKANLQKTVTGNSTAADIAAAQASVANAEAQLRKAKNGTATPADLANAEASVRSAQAKLDDLRAGPKPEKVSSAQATLDQAKSSLEQVKSDASKAKTQAGLDRDTAANAVRNAQTSLSQIYWETHDEAGNWKKKPDDAGYQNDVDRYTNAQRDEQDAQTKLNVAQLAYDNAVTQEGLDIANAEAKVRDAEVQLQTVLKGATALEITQAEAALDQAKANLDKLKQGGTVDDVAAAQANLDQAKANLRKLTQGGTAADVAAAQANVDQAEANRDKLTAPPTDTDLAIQAAAVSQSEQSLKQAQLQRDNATLRAPFAGVITSVSIVPGGSASGVVMHILDRSNLYVELNLSETDVALVALNQKVELTIDALDTWNTEGVVSYISPVAEVSNGVVIYRVKISVPSNDPLVKVGMTVNTNIILSEKSDVLLVPNSALLPKGSGRAVQVPDGAGVREVDVVTGISDGSFTEVLSGLNAGDTIIAVPTAASDSGSRGLFGGGR
ncbi:efflux RND transporter periplasmic adaptor subunit [Herpetosiphon llansteffanensis]